MSYRSTSYWFDSIGFEPEVRQRTLSACSDLLSETRRELAEQYMQQLWIVSSGKPR